MLKVNPYAEHVTTRLLDFVGSATLWQRRLWTVSSITALREAVEASRAVQDGVLSEGSLGMLIGELEQLLGQDAGIGDDKTKKVLQKYLASARKEGLRYMSELHAAFEHLIPEIEAEYLNNWVANLRRPAHVGERPGPERTARYLAGFMLGSGLSDAHLHRTWTYWLRHAPEELALADVVEHVAVECSAKPRVYEVLVPFRTRLPKGISSPPAWLDEQATAAWFTHHGVRGRPRHRGGLSLLVTARDPWAASRDASQLVGRYLARMALAVPAHIVTASDVTWVRLADAEPGAKKIAASAVRAEVGAIRRNQKVFSEPHDQLLNAAFELLARVNSVSISEPAAAVAEGWAAMEALLHCHGDSGRGEAIVQRMASLVACSFPRAELTSLAHAHALTTPDTLAHEMSRVATNRDKANLVEQWLRSGKTLALANPSDAMAERRVIDILSDPGRCLADVRRHVAAAIRRLYRQRNLVLHGGRTDAIALAASVRAAVPLVGAGLDRVAHASFMRNVAPRVLAAQARVHLDMLETAPATSLVDLLE